MSVENGNESGKEVPYSEYVPEEMKNSLIEYIEVNGREVIDPEFTQLGKYLKHNEEYLICRDDDY